MRYSYSYCNTGYLCKVTNKIFTFHKKNVKEKIKNILSLKFIQKIEETMLLKCFLLSSCFISIGYRDIKTEKRENKRQG